MQIEISIEMYVRDRSTCWSSHMHTLTTQSCGRKWNIQQWIVMINETEIDESKTGYIPPGVVENKVPPGVDEYTSGIWDALWIIIVFDGITWAWEAQAWRAIGDADIFYFLEFLVFSIYILSLFSLSYFFGSKIIYLFTRFVYLNICHFFFMNAR